MARRRPSVRNVLVTGGSRGLGLGIARKLAAAGYRVIAVARKPSKEFDAAIAQAKRGKRGALHFVAFDLGKIDEIPGAGARPAQGIRPAVRARQQCRARARWRAGA